MSNCKVIAISSLSRLADEMQMWAEERYKERTLALQEEREMPYHRDNYYCACGQEDAAEKIRDLIRNESAHWLAGYEIVDATDDEMYWSKGMFPTLEEAKQVASQGDHPPVDDAEEVCTLSIRERVFGYDFGGKTVCNVVWEEYYNEDEDDYLWRVRLDNTKGEE